MGSGIAITIDRGTDQAFVQADCLFTGVQFIVAADIPGLLGFHLLILERLDDAFLHEVTSSSIDGVSDISVELGSAMIVAGGTVFHQAEATLIAEAGTEMVLAVTAGATVCQLAAGHGDEEPFQAFDDLEISHYKHVIERDGTESEQTLVTAFLVVHELNSDFGDLHGCPP
jgi:hypothetical protein